MNQRAKDLITFKVYAELKAEGQRTYIGFFWWILEPLLFLSVYYFVFGVLLNWRTTEDYVPFLIIGVSTWHWWQSSIMHCANSLVTNRPIITQVVVPKYVFPAISMLVNLIKFFFVFVIVLVFLGFYGFKPSIYWSEALVVILAGTLLAFGAGMVVAAIIPLIPDLRILLDNGMRALMFLSGIFYDIGQIKGEFAQLMLLNPIALILQNMRAILIDGLHYNLANIAYISAIAIALMAIGFTMLRVFDGKYAKAPW